MFDDEALARASWAEPHVPCDRLPDGTWVFAPVGAMRAVAGGQRVICHACGQALAAISRGHVRRHGLDLAGYRERFGLNRKCSLVAPGLAAVKALEGRARWANNAGVRAGLAVGQQLAREGVLNGMGVGAQPAGSRRAQGRAAASGRGASPVLRAHRQAQVAQARERWAARVVGLGFPTLEAYLADRVEAGASAHRVRVELGCGGSVAQRLLSQVRV